MNCINCSKQLNDDAKFCRYCGAPVTASVPAPAAPMIPVPIPAPEPMAAPPPAIYSEDPRFIYSNTPPVAPQPVPQRPMMYEEYPPMPSAMPPPPGMPPSPMAPMAPPAQKKSSSTPVIVVLGVLLFLAVAAAALLYNNNYEAVLSAVGFKRGSASESSPVGETQATETPGVLEFGFPETEPPPARRTEPETEPAAEGPGARSIPPTKYVVVFEEDHILFIRSGPSQDYAILGNIPRNGVVTATKIWDGWAYVTYNGITGWSSMEYLEEY